MVRRQVQFTEEELAGVQTLASERSASFAAIVREAVDAYLSGNGRSGESGTSLQRIEALVGKYHSGRHDIARRHDDYFADAVLEGLDVIGGAAMVRRQIQFSPGEMRGLQAVASQQSMSFAAVVRQAVDSYLAGQAPRADRQMRRERALAAIGSLDSGAGDTSRRHDDIFAEASMHADTVAPQ